MIQMDFRQLKKIGSLLCCMQDVRRWITQKVYCGPQLLALEQADNLFLSLLFFTFQKIVQRSGRHLVKRSSWLLMWSAQCSLRPRGAIPRKGGRGGCVCICMNYRWIEDIWGWDNLQKKGSGLMQWYLKSVERFCYRIENKNIGRSIEMEEWNT